MAEVKKRREDADVRPSVPEVKRVNGGSDTRVSRQAASGLLALGDATFCRCERRRVRTAVGEPWAGSRRRRDDGRRVCVSPGQPSGQAGAAAGT